MQQQREGQGGGLADGRKIAHRVVTDFAQMRIDDDGGVGVKQQRMTIGRRLGHNLRADVAVAARAVIDDHRLAP